ncbi:aldo/keto reductase [Corticicoccus populi]|uniref:Aldo/keto reductase n=1 Tax=Corticicoccus populi TaxID=1812821 RepID=A0ABW5WU68_9STAP
MKQTIKLNNGVKMPVIGYGTFRVEDSEALSDAVYTAIQTGYRSIDTAQIYGNEQSVGAGINRAVNEGLVTRDELFITTKVWNDDLSFDETIQAFEASLEKLNLDYLDLYLIHWPGKDKYTESWKALEALYKKDKVKAIGVSNFNLNHLEKLDSISSVKPAVNQIELHPRLTQKEVIAYCEINDIQIESWSPFMNGALLNNDVINKISEKYNKTAAQVIIKWNIQQGIVTIPKSMTPDRMKLNLDVFDFELSPEDIIALDSLNNNERSGPDPDDFNF